MIHLTSSKKSENKGQIPQVFIFIMALLVIGTTLFLGTKFLINLTGAACEANDAAFAKELRKAFDENAIYGTKNAVALHTPCDAVALCFVDNGAIGNSLFTGSDPIITTSVVNNVKTNIFLQTRDSIVEQGYDERIQLDIPNDLCIPARSGKFTFTIHGYGRYLKILP